MKDYIFIVIMCAAFTFFVAGLIWLHIAGIQDKIQQAYKRGYEDGMSDKNK